MPLHEEEEEEEGDSKIRDGRRDATGSEHPDGVTYSYRVARTGREVETPLCSLPLPVPPESGSVFPTAHGDLPRTPPCFATALTHRACAGTRSVARDGTPASSLCARACVCVRVHRKCLTPASLGIPQPRWQQSQIHCFHGRLGIYRLHEQHSRSSSRVKTDTNLPRHVHCSPRACRRTDMSM